MCPENVKGAPGCYLSYGFTLAFSKSWAHLSLSIVGVTLYRLEVALGRAIEVPVD